MESTRLPVEGHLSLGFIQVWFVAEFAERMFGNMRKKIFAYVIPRDLDSVPEGRERPSKALATPLLSDIMATPLPSFAFNVVGLAELNRRWLEAKHPTDAKLQSKICTFFLVYVATIPDAPASEGKFYYVLTKHMGLMSKQTSKKDKTTFF
ncbi:hypothetical protein M422DRAFT_55789 [Sphaerobolus stellatus SS14]|uniref:Uncharacterized protein n=1 Tax=Sphaerobolus stellatus (strain SS14) TaxID=990650 RepID=A0A0C9TVI8_SPHS4|nr:hypothetical protein M422DRAFT_55789 [Sphaerobolus stellatus SS14]